MVDLFSVVLRLKTRLGVMESFFTSASNDSIDDLVSSGSQSVFRR